MLRNSKGGRLSRSGGSSDPDIAKANSDGINDAFPSPTTATQNSQLHITGRGRRSPPHATHHQINHHQHNARSNVVVCGHIQTKYVVSSDLGILNFTATVPTGNTYTVTPKQMSVRRIPMSLFYEMANSVIGDNSELLEYRHLIANPKTRSSWTHSF